MLPSINRKQDNGFAIWLTGYSGAGKTTISKQIERKLTELGIRCEVLDGDIIREHFANDLGFSKEDRCTNALRLGFVAEMLTRNGICTIVSTISPYRVAREQVRMKIKKFVEVYVKCSIEECERRDVKGLYKKARSGELRQFTGISDPYEEPEKAEIECNTEIEEIEDSVDKIIHYLQNAYLL